MGIKSSSRAMIEIISTIIKEEASKDLEITTDEAKETLPNTSEKQIKEALKFIREKVDI